MASDTFLSLGAEEDVEETASVFAAAVVCMVATAAEEEAARVQFMTRGFLRPATMD